MFFAIAITAVAQVPNKENLLEHPVTFTDSDQAVAFEQFAFSELLKRENTLLKQRTIATIITLSGGAVTTVGMALRDNRGIITNAGAVIGSPARSLPERVVVLVDCCIFARNLGLS